MHPTPQARTASNPQAWHAAASQRVRVVEACVTLGVLLHLTSGLLHALGLV